MLYMTTWLVMSFNELPDVNSYQILNDFVSTKGAESPLESNGGQMGPNKGSNLTRYTELKGKCQGSVEY